MRKGAETRERILEIAEASVLAKGFAATSIEEVIAEAGITKSGFFYHFKDKNELARAMLRALRRRQRPAVRRHLRARPPAFRRSAAGLPDQPEASGRNHGRSAQRPSRLPDRQHLLSGAAVRPRGPRTRPRSRCRAGTPASAPSSTKSPRPSASRARSISTTSPICCPAWSTAASSCPRRSTTRAGSRRQVLAFRGFVKLVFTQAAQAAMPPPASAVAAE